MTSVSNKIKITVDARMYNHSGIGTYLQMLLPYICNNFEVILLGDPEMLSVYTNVAAIIPFFTPIYSVKEQYELYKLIPECDIFWSPHYNVPLLPIKAKYRMVTIHDVFHLAFYNTLSLKQKLYAKVVINKAVNASDAVITVSEFSKNEIVKYTSANPNKIRIVHNGVKQTPVKQDVIFVKQKYDLPDWYILFVGNVKPHKNLSNLLKAYQQLSDDVKAKYKVVVVGKKDGFITGDEALINWIDNTDGLRDNVIFTGFVADEYMDTIYAAASVFAFPSLYEGFGLPPLEAMLNNCAVISSDTASLPEVCGDAAIYFNPANVNDIAEKLHDILTNKTQRERLTAKGLQRIKLFTWQKAADEHINLFNRLIK